MRDIDDKQLDHSIRQAFATAPIPSGAQERARQRLMESMQPGTTDAAASSVEQPQSVEQPKSAVRPGVSRRYWSFAGATAIAACLAWVCVALLSPGPVSSKESLAAGSLLFADSSEAIDWQTGSVQLPSRAAGELAISAMQLQPVGYARIANDFFPELASQQLEVWRLHSRREGKDVFWLSLGSSSDVPELLSAMREINSSGKWSIAAMQVQGELYVVVSPRHHTGYLRSQSIT